MFASLTTRHRVGAVLALDLILAVVWDRGAWHHHALLGGPTDPQMFAWFFAWVAHAVPHGLNPFFTHAVAAPRGANLMWSTSVLGPAMVMMPVTWAFGAVVSHNLTETVGVALNGWLAFLAYRRVSSSDAGALIGSLLYGFSPFVAGQSVGHINLILLAFPPLALLLGHELLVRQQWPWWLAGGLLGAAAALQLLTSSEVLLLSVLVGVVLVAAMRSFSAHAVRGFLTSGVVGLALAAYPLGEQFLGSRRIGGRLQPPNVCVTDLASLVQPSSRQMLSTTSLANGVARFSCYGGEFGGYFGIPLLLLLVVSVAVLWKVPSARLAALGLGVAIVLATGPSLHVHGHDTGVPMPWRLVGGLPVLRNVLPDRFMVLAFLCAGWLVALLVGDRPRWLLVAAVALVPMFPVSPPVTRLSVPAFFSDGAIGGTVVVTPLLDHGYTAMTWQAASRFRFDMIEGAVFIPGPSFSPPQRSPLFGVVRAIEGVGAPAALPTCGLAPGLLPGGCRAPFLGELRADQVTAVVVAPGPGSVAMARFWESLLGTPPLATEGVLLWRVASPA